jgi:hypothetical protein
VDKRLWKKLGIDPESLKSSSNEDDCCDASDECHQICHWLLDQVEFAQKQYDKAVKAGDEIAAYRIRVCANAIYDAAVAIHDGVHLD